MLVVGGGEIARRKIELVMRAGAIVEIVAPEIIAELAEPRDNLSQRYEAYAKHALTNQALVIAATNDEAVNEQVSHDAKALGIPVNVVDGPA
ncbi:MAG: NAD(P)-dependent oxidoreductase, partial [Gammaproteobacteria bacterium]